MYGLCTRSEWPNIMMLPQRPVQEDCPLHTLPTEIFESIFQYLDPISMVRLSCTCALFYNLVNQVAKWQTWTLKVMENPSMAHLPSAGLHFGVCTWKPQELIQNKYPQQTPWKQIFYCTQFWSMIKNWNYSLTYETLVEHDEIKSVDIAGQDIVFGTNQGILGLWNPDHNQELESLHRFKSEVLTVLVKLCPGGYESLPRYEIIAKCRNRSIGIYDMTGDSVKILGSSNYTGISSSCDRNVFYEWDPASGFLSHLSISEKKIISKQLPQLPLNPVVAVYGYDGVSENENQSKFKQVSFPLLMVSCRNGPAIVTFIERPSGHIFQSQYQSLLTENNLYIYKAYIWPGQVSLSLTGGGLTIISVGNQVNKIRWPYWKWICTSAALFGNIFLVGTSTGTILFYPFKSPEDLLNLDPNDYKKKLETGSSEALVHVGIRVQNDIHSLPDIFAASRTKLFCFRV
ncbi:uncharacterized protein LOC113202795 [Frankliniella occidentalis]|uniref:Uncharacterized protein LOC113202795 n=1 Tax=Frankliniella occidentalis TaxID=133901 RepID=A0A6J1S2E9_FRAOC|nr:uncharacterized protein LOC113202795 [Frankliniella occidentalis]